MAGYLKYFGRSLLPFTQAALLTQGLPYLLKGGWLARHSTIKKTSVIGFGECEYRLPSSAVVPSGHHLEVGKKS